MSSSSLSHPAPSSSTPLQASLGMYKHDLASVPTSSVWRYFAAVGIGINGDLQQALHSQNAWFGRNGTRAFLMEALVQNKLPGFSLVWAGPEASMHREPYRFGVAEATSVARWTRAQAKPGAKERSRDEEYTAAEWSRTVRAGMACHAGMNCFWRDVFAIPQHQSIIATDTTDETRYRRKKDVEEAPLSVSTSYGKDGPRLLAKKTILSLEPTWERGGLGRSERKRREAHQPDDAKQESSMGGVAAEELCFLTPPPGERRHAIAIPFPSPFSASDEDELRDHINMVLWEGRRTNLVANVRIGKTNHFVLRN